MTNLERALLEVYATEAEKEQDPVRYPFTNPYSTARRGKYINLDV